MLSIVGGEKVGSINIKPEVKNVKFKGTEIKLRIYSRRKFQSFNPKVLGLGDISVRTKQTDALAVVFDLADFTKFCRQVDPHLSMPDYLNRFLNWLFKIIREELVQRSFRQGKYLYAGLPFFAKFLGDGVLFLWDTSSMDIDEICNAVITMRNICMRYSKEFVPEIEKDISDVPPALRCGVARGIVCSVGNGEDFVGPCINIASRLQKLSKLQICFSRRGLDFEQGMQEKVAAHYVVKSVVIRGIGDRELVCVRKVEFENLRKPEKALFSDV